MRIVVTGASGNKGTSLLQALAGDPRVTEIVGIARRVPTWGNPRTTWVQADVTTTPLEPVFAGADAVVHLAWLIQPSRDERVLHAVNVEGSRRVFEAAATAGAGALVHASSIGAYSPGPKDRPVAEDWPTDGIPTSFYSRHKAACERMLDDLETRTDMRIVRLRPGLVFKAEAGAEIRRYFAGPLLPSALVHPALLPFVPRNARLVFQAVHSVDAAAAYKIAALESYARGAYNIAADPVLDGEELGRALGARPVPVPAGVLRAAADLSWRLRLQPTPSGWVDLAHGVPVMDTSRARDELGWRPTRTASEALLDLLRGMRESGGLDTPPLKPDAGGPLRIKELLTGIGGRNP
jgi:nucleoside-diphosphate-sugar epimerase